MIALALAFGITLLLGKTIFSSNSPLINKGFFSKLFAVNNAEPTITPVTMQFSSPASLIQPTEKPFVEPQIKPSTSVLKSNPTSVPVPTMRPQYPTSIPIKQPNVAQPTTPPAKPEPTSAPLVPYPGSSNNSYGTLDVISAATDRPAEQHADLNLALRGYVPTTGSTALSDLAGDTDQLAPQFTSLLSNNPFPPIIHLYQMNGWDWSSNSRTGPVTDPEVSMFGIQTTPGEDLHVLRSGYDIGEGYQAMVLYASKTSITMKYTREDNVVSGYTLSADGIWVDPNLLSLYEQLNSAGRHSLPALHGGDVFGIASNNEARMVMRDTGTFMDIRSRKDWWH